MASGELDLVFSCAERLRLGIPLRPRFPFHVRAINLAKYLRESPVSEKSIWHYLCGSLEQVAHISITVTALRRFVEEQIVLLVIDGYDEVSVVDREDVLAALIDFADEARLAELDVATVMTSRPQAYDRELNQHGFIGWSLAPLEREESMACAARLVDIYHYSSFTMQRFEQALRTNDTQELLYTPLHVFFIASLLEESGDLPREDIVFSRAITNTFTSAKWPTAVGWPSSLRNTDRS